MPIQDNRQLQGPTGHSAGLLPHAVVTPLLGARRTGLLEGLVPHP